MTRNVSDLEYVHKLKQNNRLNDIIKKFISRIKSRKIWVAIFSAQVLALIICGTGVTNSQLSEVHKVNIPTTQSIVNYALLALIYIPMWLIYNRKNLKQLKNDLRTNWWKYILITFADVEANYLIIKAYSLTLLTTIQVIDAFILPIALILSRIILKVYYKANNIVGVVFCLTGCALIIVGDVLVKGQEGTHKLLGDFLCLGSSILYATSNVGQEFFVKKFSKLEYLAMTGFYGTIISIIQLVILERNEVTNINFSDWKIVYLLMATNLLMFLLYSFFPHVIEISSAAFININLLTADFYAVIIGVFVYKYKLHFTYFIGFFFIFIGTIAYCIQEPTVRKVTTKVDVEQQQQQNNNLDNVETQLTLVDKNADNDEDYRTETMQL